MIYEVISKISIYWQMQIKLNNNIAYEKGKQYRRDSIHNIYTIFFE